MVVVPLTITPSDPLAKFLLSDPMIICCASLDVLIPQGGMLPPVDAMIPRTWKLKLLPGHFRIPKFLDQQEKKGVTVVSND